MGSLPARGPAVRDLGLPLPPQRMPLWRHGRPLKRWIYVGAYTPELMLCVVDARIGPLPRRWWAVAEPGGRIHDRSSATRGGVSIDFARVKVEAAGTLIDLRLGASEGVETISPGEGALEYIWTRKKAGIPVEGTVAVGGLERRIEGPVGFMDESAGYHPRHTEWKWSAGVGRTVDGGRVAWNLVSGIHDGAAASERTLWQDGTPRELGPVGFAADLSQVSFAEGGRLEFTQWAARRERVNLVLVRSAYVQPFGTSTGELPGGIRLAEGSGVMEDHDVWW